jgi:hypothetical protein
MSTTTRQQPVPSVPFRPMTVDEFARTPEYDDNRVELIDAYIVRRDEPKPAHVGGDGMPVPADWGRDPGWLERPGGQAG